MKYQNTIKQIILPIVVVLIFIIGIYIGRGMSGFSYINQQGAGNSIDKLSSLLNYIESDYVDSVSRETLNEDMIPLLLEKLDPHSVYIAESEVSEHSEPLEGNFEGIGIQFNMVHDTLVVLQIIPLGPSEKAGLLNGDRIISVENETIAGKGLTSEEIIKKLKGKRLTKVTVGVKRAGVKNILKFTITRDKIPIYSVDASFLLSPKTGYIKINKFARTTHSEFVNAVTELIKDSIKTLVIDLRGNSGGYMEAAIAVADEFLTNNELIVYTQGKARSKTEYFAEPGGIVSSIKPIILIDSWSASASEIVAGALQDNDLGLIIGRRSFGKGLVQEPVFFPDGSLVRLTVARYYTPSGRSIQKAYTKDVEKYEFEIHERMTNGELSDSHNIHFADSLKFTTKGGRIVYGGGGIMPDIYVQADTSFWSEYLKKINNQGIIYRFALEYCDLNRAKLNKFSTAKSLLAHLKASGFISELVQMANKNNISFVSEDFEKSKKYIENLTAAYIARIILNESAYIKILSDQDPILIEAIKQANNSQ